jgi:NitT/TauT family transport system substrate-binding protein
MNAARQNSADGLGRRRFLISTSALGATSLLGLPHTAAAEPPPETRRIRLIHLPAICFAPQYLAEELLRLEGFTDVSYVDTNAELAANLLTSGQADLSMEAAPTLVYLLDPAKPVVALSGIHAGCFELFGNDRVHAIRDLKGKDIAVST